MIEILLEGLELTTKIYEREFKLQLQLKVKLQNAKRGCKLGEAARCTILCFDFSISYHKKMGKIHAIRVYTLISLGFV